MIGKFVINTAWMLLMVAISGMVYVRMAPHDTAGLHMPPPMGAAPDAPIIKVKGGLFEQLFDLPPAAILDSFHTVALSTPRTRVLAGSVEEGMITYVTHSRIFGFPDYTTIRAESDGQGSRVTIYGRLRFGWSDFGVNSARVRGWLDAVKAIK